MTAKLRLTAVSFEQACAFVTAHHRHHAPPVGHKFSLGAMLGDQRVGVAIVGRPVARVLDDSRTLEVTRLATDGTPTAASFLYAAARQATYALGYDRLVTYTQHGETGASLRGAGWRWVANRPARPGWDRPSRPRRELGTEQVQRTLWEAS